jgi:hypothetical protein
MCIFVPLVQKRLIVEKPFLSHGFVPSCPSYGDTYTFFFNFYSQIKLFFLKYEMSLVTLIVKDCK